MANTRWNVFRANPPHMVKLGRVMAPNAAKAIVAARKKFNENGTLFVQPTRKSPPKEYRENGHPRRNQRARQKNTDALKAEAKREKEIGSGSD